MKITKGTIVRLIAVVFVVINLILKALGKNPIDADEGTIGAWVEMILEVAVIITAFWKNNSFSKAAIKADEFLQSLRSEETGSGGSMTYDSFVNHYLGKSTDWDGAYGTQCVDLIKAYLYEVFNIKAGSWGNAKYYWINFAIHPDLKKNFTKISNTASFVPQKGDIVVWNKDIGSSGCGHVAIATGEGNTSEFYTYDQNWNGKPMKKVKHGYDCVYGVLRPNNQNKIKSSSSSSSGTGKFPTPAAWKNGSTPEKVFKQNDLKEEIGSLGKKESAQCYSKAGNSYLVVYDLDGTNKHKAGFVGYAGGVKKAPPESKTWINGSTSETVYADTAKKTKVGTINPRGQAYCLGKIDGMYLVLYKVANSSVQKAGFVVYSGGVK